MRPRATFSFFIVLQLLHCLTLFVAPSSSSVLPPRPSFVQHSESLRIRKGHFSSILTKALPTDERTNGRTDGRTRPLIEMRTHLKIEITHCVKQFINHSGSLFGDVLSSTILGLVIDLSCLSWANTETESGNCWFYDTDKMHLWFHLLPLMALLVAVGGYFVAWKIERNKNNHRSCIVG